jgi:hypothetical protein
MESRNGRTGVSGTLVESLEIVRSARRLRITSGASVSRRPWRPDPQPPSLRPSRSHHARLAKLDADSTLDKESPRHRLVTTLQAATAAVKAKSPADAKSFGDTLVALSRKVAEASKEGGFLGIGGTRVSKEEEQAIAEITAAVA